MEQQSIHKALVSIMREVNSIGKDRRNAQQGYNFRGIDDVYNALNPLLSKHGVFTVPEVVEEKREERQTKQGGTLLYSILKMRYTFFAEDGSNVQAVVVGEGMDSGDKATNKAMAVAHKYALLQIFAIPTEEAKDPENDSHAIAPRNPGDSKTVNPGADNGGNSERTDERHTATQPPVEAAMQEHLGAERVGDAEEPKPSSADIAAFRAKCKRLDVQSTVIAKFATDRYGVVKPADLTKAQLRELSDKILPGLQKGTILPLDATKWPLPLANEGKAA